MKNIFLLLIGTAIIISVLGYLNMKGVTKGHLTTTTSQKTQTKQMTVGEVPIEVEIADTDSLRQKGLSGRNSLSENSGMLFVFPKNSFPSFWMKDMNFSLDFIWISDSKVSQINENVQPEPGKTDSQLTLYSPRSPIDYVLEVNAGFVAKHNIKVGDAVTLPQ